MATTPLLERLEGLQKMKSVINGPSMNFINKRRTKAMMKQQTMDLCRILFMNIDGSTDVLKFARAFSARDMDPNLKIPGTIIALVDYIDQKLTVMGNVHPIDKKIVSFVSVMLGLSMYEGAGAFDHALYSEHRRTPKRVSRELMHALVLSFVPAEFPTVVRPPPWHPQSNWCEYLIRLIKNEITLQNRITIEIGTRVVDVPVELSGTGECGSHKETTDPFSIEEFVNETPNVIKVWHEEETCFLRDSLVEAMLSNVYWDLKKNIPRRLLTPTSTHWSEQLDTYYAREIHIPIVRKIMGYFSGYFKSSYMQLLFLKLYISEFTVNQNIMGHLYYFLLHLFRRDILPLEFVIPYFKSFLFFGQDSLMLRVFNKETNALLDRKLLYVPLETILMLRYTRNYYHFLIRWVQDTLKNAKTKRFGKFEFDDFQGYDEATGAILRDGVYQMIQTHSIYGPMMKEGYVLNIQAFHPVKRYQKVHLHREKDILYHKDMFLYSSYRFRKLFTNMQLR